MNNMAKIGISFLQINKFSFHLGKKLATHASLHSQRKTIIFFLNSSRSGMAKYRSHAKYKFQLQADFVRPRPKNGFYILKGL